MVDLDRIDRLILRELQQDGRLSNQELADRVGLSPSPCLRRVRHLEQAGVIEGYRAVVSAKAVDLTITAFVRLRLASHEGSTVDAVEERLRAIPHIVEAHLLAGDWDYLVRIVRASTAPASATAPVPIQRATPIAPPRFPCGISPHTIGGRMPRRLRRRPRCASVSATTRPRGRRTARARRSRRRSAWPCSPRPRRRSGSGARHR